MNNRLPVIALVALGVVAGAVMGAVMGAVGGAAGAQAVRPIWNYHNGNTLMGHSADYRAGYYVGVIDGYGHAHMRREETGENALWLDKCLSAGWTIDKATRVMADVHEGARPRMWDPAADIVLDGLKQACGAAPK